MTRLLAFDIYGTLIDTQAVALQLGNLLNSVQLAKQFAQQWRDKQLEYSFRRGLMGTYEDFSVCTRQALDYCCSLFDTPLSDDEREQLMSIYSRLPAFSDVHQALPRLANLNFRMVPFSNGSAKAVQRLLDHSEIADYFEDVISVEAIPSFKPDPRVYHYLLQQTGEQASSTMLVSSNPFDVIGAANVSMQSAWIARSGHPFDPWGIDPDHICPDLLELEKRLAEKQQ